MNKTNEKWQWPLKNYFAGYEARLLKTGDAVLLVEQGAAPRNVIVTKTTDDGFFVGETDYCPFCSCGIMWRIAPPEAGTLTAIIKQAAFSEAIWRLDNELHLEAEDIPELTQEVFENLYESDYFIDAEICAQITKETAEDFLERCGDELSPEMKEKLTKGLKGDC